MEKILFFALVICSLQLTITAQKWHITDISELTQIESTIQPTFLNNNNTFLIVGTNQHVYHCTFNPINGTYTYTDMNAPTDGSSTIPLTNLPLTYLPGSSPPYVVFGGVNSANQHVFTAVYYISQPIWTVFDVTTNIGVATSSLPLTAVNSLEFASISNTNNHIITASEDPTTSKTYVYDLTETAQIPATNVPISILYNVYPNIQLISSSASDSHVYASYFNQPTSSGWAVYDLTESDGIPATNYTIGVASGNQFFIIGANSHVYNCIYGSGLWSTLDMTSTASFPLTNVGVTVFWTNPVQLAIVGQNNHVYFAYYTYDRASWSVYDMTTQYGFPTTAVPVVAFSNQSFMVTGLDQHVYYLALI